MLSGLLGGLVGAVAVAALRTALGDGPSPSAVVWAKYLGDGDPTHYSTQGRAVHLVYGALAGAAFVATAGALSLGVATVGGVLLWAVVWSVLLFAVALGVWMHLLVGHRPDARELAELGGVHLAFGVVLGLFVAFVPTI